MPKKALDQFSWIDAAGRRRRVTNLQKKILFHHIEHPDKSLRSIAQELHCGEKVVYTTMQNPACKAFEDSILAMEKTRLLMSVDEKRMILAEIARADVTLFEGPDGLPVVTADNPNRRAVAEYEVNTIGHDDGEVVTRRKIKLVSRLEAIDLDNKMVNLYKTETQININNAVVISEVVMVRPDCGVNKT